MLLRRGPTRLSNRDWECISIMRDIKRIFVHCTASSQSTTIKALQLEFKRKGWRNPGYHYVVDADGKITQLLDDSKISNGVQGWNSNAINVAYIGGIDAANHAADNRTPAQKSSLVSLLKLLIKRYPDAAIMGHRDIWGAESPGKWKKMCPCFNATAEYKELCNGK